MCIVIQQTSLENEVNIFNAKAKHELVCEAILVRNATHLR